MSDPILGPYDHFPIEGANPAPLFLIKFDKRGACQSPRTLDLFLDQAKRGNYTDVHVFSHGWNNVFKEAVALYRNFFKNYFDLRAANKLNHDTYRPAMVGVVWPSTLLVLPWESTPKIAAAPQPGDPAQDDLAGADQEVLDEVAGDLTPEQSERLYALVERGPTLNPDEARELARLLLPIYQSTAGPQSSETGQSPEALTEDDLLAIWQKTSPSKGRRSTEAGLSGGGAATGQPAVAGVFSWLDPRWPVRLASVLQMKDRAGTVGATGVGPQLVQPLLAIENVRTHLVGHSYGSKVILSSLCCRKPQTPAASILLLEPAISYLSFAANIDGKGLQGGYRAALDSVRQPVFSTFSSADAPLAKFFHQAVNRKSDWGEQRIAGMPPNRFAALGGYGPGGLHPGESKTIDVLSPDRPYPRGEPGIKIYGLNGSNGQITGHGDVATKYTAWAHLNLVSGGELK